MARGAAAGNVPRGAARGCRIAAVGPLLAACAAALLATACATRPLPPAPGGDARVTFTVAAVTGHTAHGNAAPGRAFTADTLVRVASVSKLVTTLGAMRLVEAGTLDLDRDVSDYLGWPLRNPAFPAAPVTLRMLLSHTSGLIDQGDDYAVPLGRTLQAAIGPANWSAHAPGTWFHYTNFNFPVVATAMERATGERFDRLLARLVLTPLGLDACYNWATCSDGAVARAAVLTDATGVPVKDDLHGAAARLRRGQPRRCGELCALDAYRPGDNGAVFSPQGGLRISAFGLARIGRLLLGDGAVDGVRLLQPATVAVMRTPQWRYDGHNGDSEDGFYCAYGLGEQLLGITPGCRDDLFGDGRPRDGHAGEAYHVRSGLWVDRARGTGVAFVATAVAEPAPVAAEFGVHRGRTRAGDGRESAALTRFRRPAPRPVSPLFRRDRRMAGQRRRPSRWSCLRLADTPYFDLCDEAFQALSIAGDRGSDTSDGSGPQGPRAWSAPQPGERKKNIGTTGVNRGWCRPAVPGRETTAEWSEART